MSTLTKALVLAWLLAHLGVGHAMDAPPPVHKGWQRMVIDTTVYAWSGPQLPGVDIGTPISGSWIFNSDVVAPVGTSVREFALKLAGVAYDGGDLIGDALMLNYEGTQGISGSFTLQAQGGLPELHMSFFEEFSTSHLMLAFGQDGRVEAVLNGHFEAVLPEPASYLLVLAALSGTALARRRRRA